LLTPTSNFGGRSSESRTVQNAVGDPGHLLITAILANYVPVNASARELGNYELGELS
jgi:hypothetical protein